MAIGQVMSSYDAVYGVPVPRASCSSPTFCAINGPRWLRRFRCDAVADVVHGHHYVKTMPEAVAVSLKAGTDLDCGRAYAALVEAVEKKLVTEKEIDTALTRVLTERFRLGLFDPSTPWDKLTEADNDTPASSALALKAACESIVLLKNDGLLPLDRSKIKHLAIIGGNAKDTNMLLGNYNGTPSHPVSIFDGITTAAGTNVQVDYAAGPPLAVAAGTVIATNSPAWQDAMKIAQGADVIIYVGGINGGKLEGEEMRTVLDGFLGGDRTRIELPEVQEKFVQALGALHKPVVFVNCSGSAMALKWEAANLPAIVQAWYPGENGGTAVGEVLFGDANPPVTCRSPSMQPRTIFPPLPTTAWRTAPTVTSAASRSTPSATASAIRSSTSARQRSAPPPSMPAAGFILASRSPTQERAMAMKSCRSM